MAEPRSRLWAAELGRRVGRRRLPRLLAAGAAGHAVLLAFLGFSDGVQGYFDVAYAAVPFLLAGAVAGTVAEDRETGLRALQRLAPASGLHAHGATWLGGLGAGLAWGVAGLPLAAYLGWAVAGPVPGLWAAAWGKLLAASALASLLGLALGHLVMPGPGRTAAMAGTALGLGFGLALAGFWGLYGAAARLFDAGLGRVFYADPVYALLEPRGLPRLAVVGGLPPGLLVVAGQLALVAAALVLMLRVAHAPLGWRRGRGPAPWAVLFVAALAAPGLALPLAPPQASGHSYTPEQLTGLPPGLSGAVAAEVPPLRVGEPGPAVFRVHLDADGEGPPRDVRGLALTLHDGFRFEPSGQPPAARVAPGTSATLVLQGTVTASRTDRLGQAQPILPAELVADGWRARTHLLLTVGDRGGLPLLAAAAAGPAALAALGAAVAARGRDGP